MRVAFPSWRAAVHGNPAHERNGVPNEDSGNVEEQVRQCDLEGLDTVGHHGGKQGRHGGSNVGSESQGVHLLEVKDTHTNEWGQGRGGDGRRLHENGDSGSDHNGKVSVDVRGLVDDTRRHAQKHLLENGDEANEARDQNHQREEEAHAARHLVIVLIGVGIKESGALVGRLVASNETNLSSVFLVGSLGSSHTIG